MSCVISLTFTVHMNQVIGLLCNAFLEMACSSTAYWHHFVSKTAMLFCYGLSAGWLIPTNPEGKVRQAMLFQ